MIKMSGFYFDFFICYRIGNGAKWQTVLVFDLDL